MKLVNILVLNIYTLNIRETWSCYCRDFFDLLRFYRRVVEALSCGGLKVCKYILNRQDSNCPNAIRSTQASLIIQV